MELKRYISIIAILFLASTLNAQNDDDSVTFKMELSKDKLGINERLRVDFTMNKDGDNFSPPDFNGFRIVMGPSQSISSSWVNGVRSFSKTYSYTLAPTARGKFTISQATIDIDGTTYKSLPKEVEVTAAVDRPSGEKTIDDVADESLHLVAEISKTNPYLNEAVTVVYKLYASPHVDVTNFRALDNPRYNNFWSQDIPVTKYTIENTTYDGKPYRSVILKRVVLYPQREGELELEPLSLDVSLQVPTNKRDFFGGRVMAQANKTVSAGRRTLRVKPLPTEGKPAGFSGAVGEFDFFVTPSKTHLNASESLQTTVTIKGKGNLKLFEIPQLNLPSSLEVYDPEYTENIRTRLSGMEGEVVNSYTVVPTYRGKYPIPSISFSYFNPKTERYYTLNSEEAMINVLEGPTSGAITAEAPSIGNRQLVVASSDQFVFNKLTPNLTAIGTRSFFGSTAFFMWWLLPLSLIPLAIIFGKRREAIASDVEGNKIKRANRLARKYLSAAKKAQGSKESFYVALEKALHNYLKAKLKIETSEFSKEKIATLLEEKKVDELTKDGFIGLLKSCEMARYSPSTEVQMQQDYDKASEVISQLDKQI